MCACWVRIRRRPRRCRVEGELELEEGELFLASREVKNYHINRNLFFLDDHKVLWKKSGEEGEKRLLEVPRELQAVP